MAQNQDELASMDLGVGEENGTKKIVIVWRLRPSRFRI